MQLKCRLINRLKNEAIKHKNDGHPTNHLLIFGKCNHIVKNYQIISRSNLK